MQGGADPRVIAPSHRLLETDSFYLCLKCGRGDALAAAGAEPGAWGDPKVAAAAATDVDSKYGRCIGTS